MTNEGALVNLDEIMAHFDGMSQGVAETIEYIRSALTPPTDEERLALRGWLNSATGTPDDRITVGEWKELESVCKTKIRALIAAPPQSIRDRDALWCLALCNTLDPKDIEKVTGYFQTIRNDTPPQPAPRPKVDSAFVKCLIDNLAVIMDGPAGWYEKAEDYLNEKLRSIGVDVKERES